MKKRQRKKAFHRLKTLQEIRVWVLKQKKCDARTSAVRYIDIEIDGLTKPNEHSLILKLPKARAIRFLKWEAKSNN